MSTDLTGEESNAVAKRVIRSPAMMAGGLVALACAAGLVVWASWGFQSKSTQAAVVPIQGRKLSEFGKVSAPQATQNQFIQGQRAETAKDETGKIDFTNDEQLEKRTIRDIPVVMDGAYRRVTFAQMGAWEYRAPKIPKEGDLTETFSTVAKFPAPIRELNGAKVSIEGFMIPVEVEKDKVKSFVFVSSPLVCCFGLVPQLNEWFLVSMSGDARAFIMMDLPITVQGKLSMGEEVKNRSIVSLYRIEADQVVGPRDF